MYTVSLFNTDNQYMHESYSVFLGDAKQAISSCFDIAFCLFCRCQGCMTSAYRYMEMFFYVADIHLENPYLPNESFEKLVGLSTMAF